MIKPVYKLLQALLMSLCLLAPASMFAVPNISDINELNIVGDVDGVGWNVTDAGKSKNWVTVFLHFLM